MRRSSSTWLFSACLLLAAATAGRAAVCLPPVFDGGARLHPLPAPPLYWLELLLRQHELCWRSPERPDEVRVVLAGNSAMHGFPLPVEETFGHLLNLDFAARGVPAHVFNLGFVTTYQLKDAVIIHEAVRYEPDVILYPLTFAELVHFAPSVFPALITFFDVNGPAVADMLAEDPPGLGELLEAYRPAAEPERPLDRRVARFQESGRFARLAVTRQAESLGERLGVPRPVPVRPRTAGRQTRYDCGKTKSDFAWQYDRWREWNILAYLEELGRTRGIETVVVNWPIAHEPLDDCYNVRYPAAALAEFNDWLRDQAARRGLHYVDLHDLLPPDAFLDSLHVGADGHRLIADRLEAALAPVVAARAERRARAVAGRGGRP